MPPEYKRLFFACEVLAPWPNLPKGRKIADLDRHLTLAFLGNSHFSALKPVLQTFPHPSFTLGQIGIFDSCLMLPKRHPHVVSWHVNWIDETFKLQRFQKELVHWLNQNEIFPHEKEEFLPHVTLCRQPFIAKEWLKQFYPLPMMTKNIHLYESLGHLHYQPVWTYEIDAPFSEMEHTADIAFYIKGSTFHELHLHAQMALAFKFPPILPFLFKHQMHGPSNLEEIVIDLNECIGKADAEIGSPFKAISFHDKLTNEKHHLNWEMIVDV